MLSDFKIQTLSASYLNSFVRMRLQALSRFPLWFGADPAQETDYTEAFWLERLQSDSAETYLALMNDALVGIACVYSDPRPKVSHTAHVASMYVDEAHRRQGIACSLLQSCEKWAAQKGKLQLKLSVAHTNAAGIKLYQSAGFTQYGLDPCTLAHQGETVDELLFIKKMPKSRN